MVEKEGRGDERLWRESTPAADARDGGGCGVDVGGAQYVYFTVEGERATAAELEELAAAAGADFSGGGASLVTQLSAESPAAEGETRRVWFNLEKIHLFDPTTGRKLTLHEGRAAGARAD